MTPSSFVGRSAIKPVRLCVTSQFKRAAHRLVADELECDVGWLTVPEPPLETAKSDAAPSELPLAP